MYLPSYKHRRIARVLPDIHKSSSWYWHHLRCERFLPLFWVWPKLVYSCLRLLEIHTIDIPYLFAHNNEYLGSILLSIWWMERRQKMIIWGINDFWFRDPLQLRSTIPPHKISPSISHANHSHNHNPNLKLHLRCFKIIHTVTLVLCLSSINLVPQP